MEHRIGVPRLLFGERLREEDCEDLSELHEGRLQWR